MRKLQTTVCWSVAVAISTILMLGALPASAASPDPKTAALPPLFENLFYYRIDDGQVTIIGYTSIDKDVIIPRKIKGLPVTKIGEKAFKGSNLITSVSIPSSVVEIEDQAFEGCVKTTSVVIPDSVTRIGKYAFRYCGLTSVTIPSSVTSIRRGTFEGCGSLTSVTIPDGVTDIGQYAFYNCTKLTSVAIPNSVTRINYGVFAYCTSLTSVTLPSNVTRIGVNAFRGCVSLTSIEIPNGVTAISIAAFYQCIALTSVTIPNGVASIGEFAFYGCKGLNSVVIPAGVTRIETSVFSNCSGLASVTIPGGVTRIGRDAFRKCHALKSVVMPGSLTQIERWAFADSGLHSAYFKGNAPTMPTSAFSNTAADFTIYFRNAKHGFTVPTWKGYPSVGLETFPAQEISAAQAGNFSADSATYTRSSKISLENPFTLLDGSTLTAPAITKGKQLIDGRLYLTLSYQNSSATGTPLPTVEVSSDLMDWYSGDDHTVTVVANNGFVTVRDKTATSPQAKRYIRLKPSAD